MEIVQRRRTIDVVEHRHDFTRAGESGGWSFDCTPEGAIIVPDNPAGVENLAMCLRGEDEEGNIIHDNGRSTREWSYTEPAVGKCEVCNSLVTLDGFTNTCDDCETDYNSSGQRLAPRSQWGEETGESLGDILRIP